MQSEFGQPNNFLWSFSMESLNSQELVQLILSVFPHLAQDHRLAVLVDLPNQVQEDNIQWQKRRTLAENWAKELAAAYEQMQLQAVLLVAYPNVGSNNADLPEILYEISGPLPSLASDLPQFGIPIPFNQLLRNVQLFLAPTEYSTTAPLKIAGRQYPIRAATMPGFCEAMIPALKIDYAEVGRRVDILKCKLDDAQFANVLFGVDQGKECQCQFDLRFRQGHASAGRFPEIGMVGNLPSGEAYIVPHEGEKERSQTQGIIPVQFGNDVVFYEILHNKAVKVTGEGPCALSESQLMEQEPAYCNIAELGFGVLAAFGILPIGEILLDEKLGFHIAFGRSDHFGGMVGPAQFSSPQAVVHIDRIYIPATQPRVAIKEVIFSYPNHSEEKIIVEGQYCIFGRNSEVNLT